MINRPEPGLPLRAWQSERIRAWARCAAVLVLLGYGLVLLRVVQLQTMPDPRIEETLVERSSTRTLLARRGDVVDRLGRPISMSVDGYRVFVDPAAADEAGTLNTIAADLADHLGMDPVDLDRPLHEAIARRPGTRFVPLTDPLPPERVAAIRGELRRGRLRGAGLEARPIRVVQSGTLAAPVVGAVGFEHTGLTGLEATMESRLQGHNGRLVYRRDSGRRALWVNPEDYSAPRDGQPLRLSIDLEIQRLAEDRLQRAVVRRNALGGRIIVCDPYTGEILALHDTVQVREDKEPLIDDHRAWLETEPHARWSRCATDPYEPGSTFKPFVWAAATEMGLADPAEVLPTPDKPGWRTEYGRSVRDVNYLGPVDWTTVLVRSLNSGMAMVAERMTPRDMQHTIDRFGFGQPTRVGLSGETRGIVTTPEKWTRYSQTSVAIGQEIAVTPLQMVQAFSAFASDGSMPTLRLVAPPATAGVAPGRRVMSPEVAQLTREAMFQIPERYTGERKASPRYRIFGKSGTAQRVNPEGGYFENRYTSSFIAGAPLDAPRLVVLCVIDDPDRSLGAHFGGHVAWPVVRDVMDAALDAMGVAGDRGPAEDAGDVINGEDGEDGTDGDAEASRAVASRGE
ncbi:MAG: peptidoglycan D,D-transpeptidase FtsI family protein [Phycisphaerales bacterium]